MSDNTKTKKNSKNITIVLLITVIVIIIAAVGGYFGYKYIEDNKPIEQEWANTYYNYIKDQNNEESSENEIQNNSKIGFIGIEDVENPIMVVEYNKEGKTNTDIYYINEGTVKNIIDIGISDVELLYNINTKEYNWYTHKETETEDTYEKVSNKIAEANAKATENTTDTNGETSKDGKYTFVKGEEISEDTVDGDKISIPKFDTTFVKTDVDTDKTDYNKDMTDKELKDAITEETKKYKDKDKMITDEIKSETTSKENEVKETVNKIEAEKVKKEEQKAEEAKKKAEEEAAKGLQVGNYTLKYGNYKGKESQYDIGGVISTDITMTLKQDGTYNLKSSNTSLVPNSNGTYKVEKNTYAGVSGTHILKLSSGSFYAVIANNTLQVPAGSGVMLTYQGN